MATIAECAAHLFMNERRFYELIDRGIVERQLPNRYDLDVVRRQYLQHASRVAADRTAGPVADLLMERTRLTREYADNLEMRNRDLRASLLPRGDVAGAVVGAFDHVGRRVSQIPGQTAPLVVKAGTTADVKQILTDAVHDALADLAATRVVGTKRSEQ